MATTTGADVESEEKRKEALRKAGQEYFEKVLAQASKGQDPFTAPARSSQLTPESTSAATQPRSKRRDLEKAVDPDMETVGLVFEGIKLYIITAVYLIAHAVGYVFIKASLQALHTPAVMVFLHMLPAFVLLAALSMYGSIELGPLDASTAKGSLPTVILSALQVLSLFGCLLHGSVYLVLGWTCLAPALLATARSRPPAATAVVLAAGVAFPLGLTLFASAWPSPLALALLVVWTIAEAGLWWWNGVRGLARQQAAATYGERLGDLISEYGGMASGVNAATLTFYKSFLPAIPILLLGFIFQEGQELVDHELSVPAVSMMLMSAGAWAAAVCSGLLLSDQLDREHRVALAALGSLGTIATEFVVHGVGSPVTVAACIIAMLSAFVCKVLSSN